jgi:hypothetical protein
MIRIVGLDNFSSDSANTSTSIEFAVFFMQYLTIFLLSILLVRPLEDYVFEVDFKHTDELLSLPRFSPG